MTKQDYINYAKESCNLSIDSDIVDEVCLSPNQLKYLLEIMLESQPNTNSIGFEKKYNGLNQSQQQVKQ